MSIPVLIIPVLNRYDLLEQALESIDHPIDEILVIDNGGSFVPTKDFSHLNLRILNLPSNLGVAGSWNLGIKLYPFVKYWTISSSDTFFIPGTLAKMESYSSSDRFIKSNAHYSFFSLGENIVKVVGIFDEYIYPAYFEDNDYDDRMRMANFHDNILFPGDLHVNDNGGSQTIKSSRVFSEKNDHTFVSNQNYYLKKRDSKDYTCRGWNLERRRFNSWT